MNGLRRMLGLAAQPTGLQIMEKFMPWKKQLALYLGIIVFNGAGGIFIFLEPEWMFPVLIFFVINVCRAFGFYDFFLFQVLQKVGRGFPRRLIAEWSEMAG